jgi:hypothetical protein
MADEPQKPNLSSQLGEGHDPEVAKKWAHLLAKVWADDALKRKFIENPAAVLQEYGIKTKHGVDLRVVENTDKTQYMVLPPKPAGDITKLSSSELLAGAAVGLFCCSTGGFTRVPIAPIPAPATTVGPGPILGPIGPCFTP